MHGRPYHLDPSIDMIGAPQDSFGFPSGHTAGAYLGASIMASLDPANAARYMELAQDVARSRVASGHHFATDTFEGARLGYEAVAPALAEAGLTQPTFAGPRVSSAADFQDFGVGTAASSPLADVRSIRYDGVADAA